MIFCKKNRTKKPYRIDTSRKGFEYVGIKLTEEQFHDLTNLDILWKGSRKDTPVLNTLVMMKILGLLPPEMICDSSNGNSDNDSNSDIYTSLERKFGKVIRKS
jgi:hypothetical protein